MSERMTNHGFERAVDKALAGGSAFDLVRESERARTSEDQKDAVIKTLADALVLTGFRDIEGLWHSEDCRHSDICTAVCLAANNALRLAGRL